jgi:putative tricarboxylic transport membrane protein
MNKKDFYTGLIFLILAGWITLYVLNAPTFQVTGPGPFFLPAIVALFIGGLSLALLVQSFKQPQGKATAKKQKRMWGRILWIMVWCLIYALSMERLGYLLSTGIITFALLAYFNRGKWLANIILSVATPALIFILFDTLLKVSMPRGWFGF